MKTLNLVATFILWAIGCTKQKNVVIFLHKIMRFTTLDQCKDLQPREEYTVQAKQYNRDKIQQRPYFTRIMIPTWL